MLRDRRCVELLFSVERIYRENILQSHDAQIFFEVGDSVWFGRNVHERLFGTIEKLNSKTCTVSMMDGKKWAVPYMWIDHVDESLFDARAPRARQLLEVAVRARQMMDEHGLNFWSLYFSHGRRLLGKCVYRDQAIFISRHHAVNHQPEQVNDTILHEIAHALAGPKAGHGPEWKAIALRIGAAPESRAYEKDKAERKRKKLLEAKSRFTTGDMVLFPVRGEKVVGRIVRMNPKRAKVDCGSRTYLAPYTLLKHHGKQHLLWGAIFSD